MTEMSREQENAERMGMCPEGVRRATDERLDHDRPTHQRTAARMATGDHVMRCQVCASALGLPRWEDQP